MIDWMLAARIDPLAAVIALSVALGLVVGIEMGRRFWWAGQREQRILIRAPGCISLLTYPPGGGRASSHGWRRSSESIGRRWPPA